MCTTPPSIIASQYDFPSTARGNATLFWYHLTQTSFIIPPLTSTSCFLAKWLLLHKKQLLADLCCLLGAYSPSLVTSKHSLPCLQSWQCSISDTIELSRFFLKLPTLLFSFLNYPSILCIKPDILHRWCNEPVCRHSCC